MSKSIYMDYAATSIKRPEAVIQAVAWAMEFMGNPGRGAGEQSLIASRTVFAARKKLCGLFSAEGPEQVVFTLNGTESLNTAIKGLIKPGDHVVTTCLEHNSVLRPLYLLEQEGATLTVLPFSKGKNTVDAADFQKAFRPNTKLAVCTHASNLTGDLNNIEEIGAVCRKNGVLFLVDAAQTAGVFPINMEKMNIDILSFTGHKSLMGPQGTGGLCVRKGVNIKPIKVGGSGIHSFSKTHPEKLPEALEAGTVNSHGIAGLLAALEFQEKMGRENIFQREKMLTNRLYQGLRTIPGVKIYGEKKEEKAPIVAVNFLDYDSAEVADELAERYGIQTRAGGHCAPLLHKAYGTEKQGMVRFSLSWQNTEEEVDQVIEAVRQLSREEGL